MKVLHLIDSLAYGGSAKQVKVLGPALANDATSVEVCCLGPETPWLDSLRQAGVSVQSLRWTRWFDPSVLWNLRALLHRSAADVIHVWRLPALRMLATVAPALLPRVIVSDVLPAKGKLTWWDRRLLEKVRGVAVVSESDKELCVRQGIAAQVLRTSAEIRYQDPISKKVPDTFLCVGRLERAHGFREAVWAFEILHFLFPDARLQIVGAGSQRTTLEELTAGLEITASVQFLGQLRDTTDVLRAADIVWIPSLTNCGRQIALEAMALGRPVIASNVPCLREVIDDSATGFLIPPGDVVQLARRTRMLMDDAALRERVGTAAQEQVQLRFPLDQAIEAWRDIYRTAAA